jgi:hypothetical protein
VQTSTGLTVISNVGGAPTVSRLTGDLMLPAREMNRVISLLTAVYAGLRRLHMIPLIVNGGGRACEIEDLVDFDIERECDVMPNQLEV